TGLGGIQANDIEVADFDNDGDLDVIISNFSYNSQTTQYFINNGLNIFTSQNVPFQINRANIGVLDFNNDGYMDIIEAGRNGNFIETHFLLNDSSGNFTPIQFPNVIPSNGLLEVADFNNDGKKDFILGNKTIGFEFYTGLYINASCYNKFTNVSDTACNDYTWQQTGLVYTSSGSYFDTIPSSEGCDSIL